MTHPPSPARREPSSAAVWAPWLAAPLFALLPIGGCGVADGFRSATARPSSGPAAAGPGPTEATVVTVVTVMNRRMAGQPAAH